jgi:hypothetical protein
MAENLLVTDALSPQMIEAGVKLIERLDTMGAQVKSAFWFYLSEFRTWKLIIASESVNTDGPKNFYEKIVGANNSAAENESTVSLNDIGVTSTDHKLVQVLAMMISTGAGIGGIRFSRNNINGIYIEDAYIYRSNR